MKKLWETDIKEKKKENEEVVETLKKLEAIIDKPMRYDELCKALGTGKKEGNSKVKWLNDLQMYCDLEITRHPTRYIVKEVYTEQLATLGLLSPNNKYQMMFEAVMYKTFVNNNGNTLYLSNMELIEMFGEVNQNFKYTLNLDTMRSVDDKFEDMTLIGPELYKILKRWTSRRIEQMQKRMIILTRPGFRLYKHMSAEFGTWIVKTDVPVDSKLEKSCQQIYDQAVREIMPFDWNGGWVDSEIYSAFKRRIKELIRDRFDGEYDELRKVLIISPPTVDWMNDRIKALYDEINADGIPEHSKDVVMTSKRFDDITNLQKREFIRYNIDKNPPLLFSDKQKERGRT